MNVRDGEILFSWMSMRLEIVAVILTVSLIVRVAPRHAAVPLAVKAVHFLFVLVFFFMSVAGLHFLILILRGRGEYSLALANPNPFGITASTMERLGYFFSAGGAVLCVAVIKLGEFRNWARQMVMWLAPPYCILYPAFISTYSDEGRVHGFFLFTNVMTPVCFAISVAVLVFYGSERIGKYFRPKGSL